eukprot:CAMPEP_0169303458 /NCGR_PEP_ID=MMETSP1016-20121227/69369_1 /TAXON_ID=342587 /ORGANISM="Karlodinium micrum, Strain CCMP2283" /LENGTH=67 /DNA_ID=CAMNT_0009396287 /DNA_START=522 /DNA_END=722 /DNA_ORIENTATION=+
MSKVCFASGMITLRNCPGATSTGTSISSTTPSPYDIAFFGEGDDGGVHAGLDMPAPGQEAAPPVEEI